MFSRLALVVTTFCPLVWGQCRTFGIDGKVVGLAKAWVEHVETNTAWNTLGELDWTIARGSISGTLGATFCDSEPTISTTRVVEV